MQSSFTVCGYRKMSLAVVGVLAGSLAYGSVALAAPSAGAAPATAGAAVPSVTVPVPAVKGLPAVATTAPTTRRATKPKSVKPATHAKKPSGGFVGSINARNVNIRSGPGMAYYVLGQLQSGDMVNVVGSLNGWDAISAPAGTLCYISKQFVHVGSDSAKGRVSANYVYVRAASRLAPHSDYAVVKVVSRGTHVHIVGSTPSFYVIEPPRGAHVYVLAKFVTAAGANAEYLAPKLQMPAGFKGATLAASLATGNSAVLASSAGSAAPAVTTQPGPTTLPSGQSVPLPVGTSSSNAAGNVAVTPVPPALKAPNSSKVSLFATFRRLNRQTQLEFQKPLIQRQLEPLLRGYEKLAAVAGAPAWLKEGVAARIGVLKRTIAIQELVEANRNTPPVNKVIAPYQQQWQESQKQIAAALERAPYVAKGVLRTSTVLKSKYALVNPANGRVTAYIDPTSRIDLSRLLGEYVGIKGVVTGGGAVIKVIRVATATLLPEPTIRHMSAERHHP